MNLAPRKPCTPECKAQAIELLSTGKLVSQVAEELADASVDCVPDRIRRIVRQRGLGAVRPKTYVPKTSDGRADAPPPNLRHPDDGILLCVGASVGSQPLPSIPKTYPDHFDEDARVTAGR